VKWIPDDQSAPPGTRLWACGECGHRTRVSPRDRWQRARPRCAQCGSARITPASRDGQDELKDLMDNRYRVSDHVAVEKRGKTGKADDEETEANG
jgi:hypothetical protein